MVRMFFETHKSISTLLLCCTLATILKNFGGLCQEISSQQNIESDQKAPVEEHSRVLRSASSSQDLPSHSSSGTGGGGQFNPPLTLSRYQNRVSRFHGSPRFVGGGPIGLGYGGRPVANMLVSRDTPAAEFNDGESRLHELELGEQNPTFTPFISARSLSNMPTFFEYLKANLAALHKDEGEIDSSELESAQEGDEDFRLGYNDLHSGGGEMPELQNYPEQKGLNKWAPAAFGSRANIRNFVHPSRNVYEFGLG